MKNTNILGTVVVAILIVALFAMPAFSAGSTKCAVAGSENQLVEANKDVILETVIHTGNPKDLIIFFTAESILVTETSIKKDKISDMDKASIQVGVLVDGEPAFPESITLAERTQTLSGSIEGEGIESYEINLLLDTTAANGFNFYFENAGQGDHVVEVWATIVTEDGDGDDSPSGVIGDRTLIVQEVDLK